MWSKYLLAHLIQLLHIIYVWKNLHLNLNHGLNGLSILLSSRMHCAMLFIKSKRTNRKPWNRLTWNSSKIWEIRPTCQYTKFAIFRYSCASLRIRLNYITFSLIKTTSVQKPRVNTFLYFSKIWAFPEFPFNQLLRYY